LHLLQNFFVCPINTQHIAASCLNVVKGTPTIHKPSTSINTTWHFRNGPQHETS
jgi:hypothetical protein